MYFYAKNPSKIFGGGFDLDLAEQFSIPTMFTEEQNKLLLSSAESWIMLMFKIMKYFKQLQCWQKNTHSGKLDISGIKKPQQD